MADDARLGLKHEGHREQEGPDLDVERADDSRLGLKQHVAQRDLSAVQVERA